MLRIILLIAALLSLTPAASVYAQNSMQWQLDQLREQQNRIEDQIRRRAEEDRRARSDEEFHRQQREYDEDNRRARRCLGRGISCLRGDDD